MLSSFTSIAQSYIHWFLYIAKIAFFHRNGAKNYALRTPRPGCTPSLPDMYAIFPRHVRHPCPIPSRSRPHTKKVTDHLRAIRHLMYSKRDLNPHSHHWPRDFKSLVSTDSTIRASYSKNKSGKRDSNSRPQPWQGCALPTELFPHQRECKGRNFSIITKLKDMKQVSRHR